MGIGPHLNSWLLPRVVVLFDPGDGVSREASAGCKYQDLYPRWFPQGNLRKSIGHVGCTHGLIARVLGLDDDPLVPRPAQAIADDPLNRDVTAAIGGVRAHQHLRVGIAAGVLSSTRMHYELL